MGIKHENANVGAEMDTHRENIAQYDTQITSDTHDAEDNKTVVEYIVGEGDTPFIKYRLTIEAIGAYSEEEYKKIKEKAKATAEDVAELSTT